MKERLDLSAIEVLTFDCYGTLIDWEAGILAALRSAAPIGAGEAAEAALETYARLEMELEAGDWRSYREILGEGLGGVLAGLGHTVDEEQQEALGASVVDWPAFSDSVAALARLGERFELGVITNCDDDLFDYSNARLGRPFNWVITAEQARAYKPALSPFELAREHVGGRQERWLHVAQSLYHDHMPARALGLRGAWIDRRRGRAGYGATPPASASPDLVAPDMASFAEMMLSARS